MKHSHRISVPLLQPSVGSHATKREIKLVVIIRRICLLRQVLPNDVYNDCTERQPYQALI